MSQDEPTTAHEALCWRILLQLAQRPPYPLHARGVPGAGEGLPASDRATLTRLLALAEAIATAWEQDTGSPGPKPE